MKYQNAVICTFAIPHDFLDEFSRSPSHPPEIKIETMLKRRQPSE
jgi:hypothetical protein